MGTSSRSGDSADWAVIAFALLILLGVALLSVNPLSGVVSLIGGGSLISYLK